MLSALVLGAAAPAAGQSRSFVGPLRIRDLSPLSLFRLDMPPAHAVNSVERGWGVEATYSRGNLFLVSDIVHAWLDERGTRRHITQQEALALLEEPGDVFFFDAEVATMTLTGSWALGPDWQVSLSVPYHWYGGGYLDQAIESFHETIGVRDGGRVFAPRNDVQVVARLGDVEQIVLTDNGRSGLGDAIVTLRYDVQVRPSWHLIAEGAVRAPTGREHLYFSKDEPDLGVQLSAQHVRGSTGYYGSLSWIEVSENAFFPGVSDTPTLTLAVERTMFGDHTSGIAQMTWSRSTVAGVEHSDLTEDRMQLSVGLRRRHGPFTTSLAITENVVHFKNTPDIGVHFGIGYIAVGQ